MGKASISRELASMLERLGSSAESWTARLLTLSGGRLLGRFFTASRDGLRAAAERFGVRRWVNLDGCAVR